MSNSALRSTTKSSNTAGSAPVAVQTNLQPIVQIGLTALRPSLDSDLILFLERARFPNVENFSFFYWVNNLAWPEYMFESGELFDTHGYRANVEDSEEWAERFVVLYAMNDFGSHRLGLV
jgi:hypothetical protein